MDHTSEQYARWLVENDPHILRETEEKNEDSDQED